MKDQIFFLFLGGLLASFGAILQHKLELRRLKTSELRQEKLRIYSNVLTELSSLFLDPKNIVNELSDPVLKHTFALRLGRVLGPARLVASDNLEEKLRDLYDKEVAWHDSLDKGDNDRKIRLAEEATSARILVGKEMRNELMLTK